MVGESGSGGGVTSDDGDGIDGGDDGDVSREHSVSETMENTATVTVATTAAAATATAATAATAATTTGFCRIFDTEDNQAAFAIGDDARTVAVAVGVGIGTPALSSIGSAYCGQPAAPRWHSPHVGVGAIGSEI